MLFAGSCNRAVVRIIALRGRSMNIGVFNESRYQVFLIDSQSTLILETLLHVNIAHG